MINLNIQMDIDRALSKLARIPKEVEDKALPRALNKMADQAKVQASREIRDVGYGLKVGAIKKAITVRKATKALLVSSVKASGAPLPLILFDARPVANGVTVRVKNGRKLVRGAFIATMSSGHTGVFDRNGGRGHKRVIGKSGKAEWHGLPIFELFGPSVPSAFMNDKVQDALVAAVREKFPRLLQHELAYLGLK